MATPLVGVFSTFDSGFLPGCLSFLVLTGAFQTARRGNHFNRTIGSWRARGSIRLINPRAAAGRRRPIARR